MEDELYSPRQVDGQDRSPSEARVCKCVTCGKCGNPGTIDGLVSVLEELNRTHVSPEEFVRLRDSYAAIGQYHPFRLGIQPIQGEDRYLVLPNQPIGLAVGDQVFIDFSKIDGVWSPAIHRIANGHTYTWEKYIA